MSFRRFVPLVIVLAASFLLTGCTLLRPPDIEDPDITNIDPNHPQQIRRRMAEQAMEDAQKGHEIAREAHEAATRAAAADHAAAIPPQAPLP